MAVAAPLAAAPNRGTWKSILRAAESADTPPAAQTAGSVPIPDDAEQLGEKREQEHSRPRAAPNAARNYDRDHRHVHRIVHRYRLHLYHHAVSRDAAAVTYNLRARDIER